MVKLRWSWPLALGACLALLAASCVAAPPLLSLATPGAAAAQLPACPAGPGPRATPTLTIAPAYRATAVPNPGEPQVMPADLRVFGGAAGTHGIPATDGTTVVWADGADCLHAARVRDGYDYGPITQLPGSVNLAVAGDIAAWSATEAGPACPPDCPMHLAAADIATRTGFPLAKTHHSEYAPALSGGWLVWLAMDTLPGARPTPGGASAVEQPARYTVLAQDLRRRPAQGGPISLRETTNPITYVTVEGARVVWAEQEQAGGRAVARLFARQLPDGAIEPLAGGAQIGSVVHDLRADLVLYSAEMANGSTFWALNLRTGRRKQFSAAENPTTDGRTIFWVTAANSPSVKYRLDIRGYDTVTGAEFPLASNAGVNDYPAARDGVVVWLHHPGALNFVSQVYAAPIKAP